MKTITAVVELKYYQRLRAKLIKQGKSFSKWLREQILKELGL